MLRKLGPLLLALVFALAGCSAPPDAAPAASGAASALPEPTPDAFSGFEPARMFTTRKLRLRTGDRFRPADYCASPRQSGDELDFRTNDEAVLHIDSRGEALAIGEGLAILSAVSSDSWDEILVAVEAAPGARVTPGYLSLGPAESAGLSCRISGDAGGEILWSSDDESVATVDGDGKVTATGPGATRVRLRAGKYADSAAVLVGDGTEEEAAAEPPRYEMSGGVLRRADHPGDGRARILLTGDLMALSAQQNAARSGDAYDFDGSFGLIRPIFEGADLVVGNLETCASDSQPYTARQKTVQGNPHCNAPCAYLDAVRRAGYDVVVTANNHSGDAGVRGIYETIRELDRRSLAHTGTFASESEPRYLLADVGGIRIAILSYTEILNTKTGALAIPDDLAPVLLNRYSSENVGRDVKAAREAGAEYIIAYNHWGRENTHAVTELQKSHAQEMADAGVDFIAGSHPHCLQPAEMITAADGRKVPCVYSMGNFVSSMAKDINNDTVIVSLKLRREEGRIVLEDAAYLPCRVFPEFEGASHVVVPASPGLNGGRSLGALEAARNRIAAVMDGGALRETEAIDPAGGVAAG